MKRQEEERPRASWKEGSKGGPFYWEHDQKGIRPKKGKLEVLEQKWRKALTKKRRKKRERDIRLLRGKMG